MSDIIKKLKQIINTKNPVILEIGCYRGQDTKRFLNIFDEIQLFCFEPDKKNIELFRRYIGDDSRCKLFETAISHIDGEITFYSSFGPKDEPLGELGLFERKASGSIRKPKFHLIAHPWCKFDNGTKVSSLRLDTWCEQNNINNIDLIWADVNGAELDMIDGATETLAKTRYLYTEFSPSTELYEGGITKQQIIRLLVTFEEIMVYKNNVLLKNKRIP
jgi:FkbM family methyltransferase